MSREQRPAPMQPRDESLFEDELEVREALQFAQTEPKTALPVVFASHTAALQTEDETRVQKPASIVSVGKRLAMRRELQELAKMAGSMPTVRPPALAPRPEPRKAGVRDSLVTVPPSVASVPPPALPAPAARPSVPPPVAASPIPEPVPAVAPPVTPPPSPKPSVIESVPPMALPVASLSIITPPPMFAALPQVEPVGRRGWATLIAAVSIALPGGLLLGHALTSGDSASAAAQPVAGDSRTGSAYAPPEAEALSDRAPRPAAPKPAAPPPASSTVVVADPADGLVVVHTPRPTHSGRGRSRTGAGRTEPPAGESGGLR